MESKKIDMVSVVDRMIDTSGCRTKKKLAEILGKNPSQINSWMKQSGPSDTFLLSLDFFCRKFRVNKNYILTGIGDDGGGDKKLSESDRCSKLIEGCHEILRTLILRGDPKDEEKILWYQTEIDRLAGVERAPLPVRSLKNVTK